MPQCWLSLPQVKRYFRHGGLAIALLHASTVPALAQTAQSEQTAQSTQTKETSTSSQQDWQLEKAYELALYHYFQGDFFQALSQFKALQELHPDSLKQVPQRLASSNIEPELLKGGISLAYGLEEQATEIFSRLLSPSVDDFDSSAEKTEAQAKTETLAWMLLGKTYYQKRQFPAAARAFEKISLENAEEFLPTGIRDEWLYLQSQLYGYLTPAEGSSESVTKSDWLADLSSDSIYRDYVQYNQALGLLEQDRLNKRYPQRAIALLTALGQKKGDFFTAWLDGWWSPLDNDQAANAEEFYALKDRANLTLGYTYLQQQQPFQAQQAFQQVRMQSLDSQAALLGYGWAAAKDQDYQIALAIWQQLRQSPAPSEYVLEAYLASAFAYEQAFAPVQAIDMLQQAMGQYRQKLSLLQEAKSKVADEGFIRSLVEADDLSALIHNDSALSYLSTILLSNDFRTKITALEQSISIQKQLQNWQQRMGHYHLMLDERQSVRKQRAKQLLQNRLLEDLTKYQASREQLASVLQQAQQQGNGMILMPAESIPSLQRLDRALGRQQGIGQAKQDLGQAPFSDKYSQRLKRLQGILAWQASEQYEGLLRQAQKELKQVDSILAEAQQKQSKLLALLADRPEFVLQRQRIGDIEQRLSQQVSSNSHLQQSLVAELRFLFGQMLDGNIDKIQSYQVQAQLAVVRLNDQAFRKAIEEQRPSSQIQGRSK
jgi:hypothetical protein